MNACDLAFIAKDTFAKKDWTDFGDMVKIRLAHRHVYLVMPTYQGNPTKIGPSGTGPSVLAPHPFYNKNDISVHTDTSTYKVVANTLGDLTKRECRYGHSIAKNADNGFPHAVDPSYLVPFGGTYNANASPTYSVSPSGARYGEDVVLTNVLAFDVQVWDPTAPVYSTSGSPSVSVAPGDPGFVPSLTGTPPNYNPPASLGAFVDLNWGNLTWPAAGPKPVYVFGSQGHPKSQLQANTSAGQNYSQTWLNYAWTDPQYKQPATYDTWSSHYEHDGVNQASHTLITSTNPGDLASDGFQDDADKLETSPPYPVPLRGIRVKIRCYEPDARQVHEVTVVESFVPE
jgi:hypothetical protein